MSATSVTTSSSTPRTKRSSPEPKAAAQKKAASPREKKSAAKKTTTRATVKRITRAKSTTERSGVARRRTRTEPPSADSATAPVEVKIADTNESGAVSRKAPTTLPGTQSDKFRPPVSMVVVGVVSVGLFLSGAIVGYSDPGEIDVQFILEQRAYNLAVERGEVTDSTVIPVQSSADRTERPRLRPAVGVDAPRPSTPNLATTTATTTAETATSTTADSDSATSTVDTEMSTVDSEGGNDLETAN